MKIAVVIARVLMGLMFLNASIGYFFDLYPAPAEIPQEIITYMSGISVVHLLTIVKSIELICAISFLAGRYVALFLVVLLPITINILLLHAAVPDPASLSVAIAVFALHIFLLYAYRKHYAGMFVARRME
jgi:putative oxidoreductase